MPSLQMPGRIKEDDEFRGLGPGREVPSPSLFLSPGTGLARGSLGLVLSDPLRPQGAKSVSTCSCQF